MDTSSSSGMARNAIVGRPVCYLESLGGSEQPGKGSSGVHRDALPKGVCMRPGLQALHLSARMPSALYFSNKMCSKLAHADKFLAGLVA